MDISVCPNKQPLVLVGSVPYGDCIRYMDIYFMVTTEANIFGISVSLVQITNGKTWLIGKHEMVLPVKATVHIEG